MSGSAELRFGPGRLAGEPLQSLVARATFSGSDVISKTSMRTLSAGHIIASGTYNTTVKRVSISRARRRMCSSAGSALSPTGLDYRRLPAPQISQHMLWEVLPMKIFRGYQITFDGTGKDVTINGRPAGTLALVGRTENQTTQYHVHNRSAWSATGDRGQRQPCRPKLGLGA